MGICGSQQAQQETPKEAPKPVEREPTNNEVSDSDFVFFIEMESDSDEVSLDPVEKGYPTPKPPNEPNGTNGLRLSQILVKEGFSGNTDENENEVFSQEQIDDHARKAPTNVSESFEELIQYLEKPFKTNTERDTLLVRAILVWLSNQNVQQSTGEANTNSPSGYLSMLQQKRTTYSTFFTELCRAGDVKCAQIHGVCKAGDYEPGDQDDGTWGCLWNAVYLNNNWHIVHPFWACRSVFGKVSGGWIKLEEGGKAVGKRLVESSGILRNAFQDYYIMPKPNQFLYACHPNDTKWQLVRNTITRKQFVERSYLHPPFWEFGMELNTVDKCALNSKNGKVYISFSSSSKIANELDVWYELLLRENTSGKETELLNQENIPKLVTLSRNSPEWDCRIQFPASGEYKIVFYCGKYKERMFRIAEFRLLCQKPKQACMPLPFNPGRLAFGPGPATEEAGLLLPSHKNGIINTDQSKETIIKFFLDSDFAKHLAVKANLITLKSLLDEQLQKKINKQVSYAIEKSGKEQGLQTSMKELIVTTNVHDVGDCYLQISTNGRSNRRKSNSEDDMSVVCNYHLSTSDYQSYEYGHKRFARRQLLKSVEGNNIEEIQSCITKCENAHFKSDDPDIVYARSKVEVLSLRKAIHEAKQRRHLGVTLQTIEQLKNSKFERIFRRDVKVLKKLAETLRALNGFTQELPRLSEALLELCNRCMPNVVVQNVLTAFLLLFGEQVEPDWEFEDIQSFSKRLYGNILQQQESRISEISARRAQTVLQNCTIEETMVNTMAATKMQTWINDVVTTVLKGYDDGSDEHDM